MAGERTRIGLREVRALGPGEEVWDTGVAGFGARRQRSEAVAYILMFRTGDGRLRRFTIGRHGAPWTPDTARDRARELLVDVSKGIDPATEKKEKRHAATVADLCDQYIEDAEAGRLLTRRGLAKKASTLLTDRGRIAGHIKPQLGTLKVPSVTRRDIERFMHAIAAGETKKRQKTAKRGGLSILRGGKGTASRTVGLLGAIFTYAQRKGLRSDNPVHGVVRYADNTRERRLSDDEYKALGIGLAKAAEAPPAPKSPRKGSPPPTGLWPAALACARFLALTGWRSGEALGLRWGMVDLARRTALLPDTKTGRSMRPLSRAACKVLIGLGGGAADALVFPPTRGEGAMSGFPSMFARITKAGGLPLDITPHVLRHSFASVAADLEYSEITIGTLIGHKGHSITSRYTHAADAVLLAAADRVAGSIAARMAGNADTAPAAKRSRRSANTPFEMSR